MNLRPNTNYWHFASTILIAIYGLLIVITFRDYGITSDEAHHIKYGADIVQWYNSGFTYRALFETNNIYLYGGLFDTVGYLTGQFLPLDRYDANHLLNAFIGLLGIIAAQRIGTALGGPAAGFFAALFLIFTPRYYGHAFNNPKDLPFAVFYLWTVYYLVRYVSAFPNLSRSLIIKTGLMLGFALGIRIGGVLLVAYVLLFTLICIYQNKLFQWHKISPIIQQLGAIFAIAYSVMLLCWPWALTQPLTGPVEAIFRFSQFSEPHYSFFDSQYVISTNLPRFYAPMWLCLTLPEFSLLSLALGIILLIFKRRANFSHLLLLFVGIFPILYAVIMQTPLYDGIRHLLFAIPPLVIFAAITFSDLLKMNAQIRYISLTIVGISLALTGGDMVQQHPNQYIYFNRLIAGGVDQAATHYETDYWENSFKQGIRWIEKNKPSNTKQSIGGFSENIHKMLNSEHFEFQGYPEQADIYIGVTRYDNHRKVPGEILHKITVQNTPILYIIRPDTSYRSNPFFDQSPFMHYRTGEIYDAEKQHQQALASFLKAQSITVQQNSESPFLFKIENQIGNQYSALQRYEHALTAYHRALKLDPKNAPVHNNIGVVFGRKQNYQEADQWLQKAIELQPDYFGAYVNQAGFAAAIGDLERTQRIYLKALSIQENPTIRKSLALIQYRLGNYEAAASNFKDVLKTNPKDADAYHSLALSLVNLNDYINADRAAAHAIALSPNGFDAYFTRGSIAMYLQHYSTAVETYKDAIQLKPDRADAHSALGIALLALEKFTEAQQAFENVLRYDPNNTDAQQYLQQLKNRSTP